jgi:hypothetical protein
MFAYLVDGRGVRAVFRPGNLVWTDSVDKQVEGGSIRVPRRFRFEDRARGLRVTVDVGAVHATDRRRPRRRWFLQMRGVATVEEGGKEIGRLGGFFETYVDSRSTPGGG